MATRMYSVVVDTADVAAQARFWSEATGWPITYDADDEKVVEPPDGEPGSRSCSCLSDDPKVGKNRIHLDLNARSEEHQATWVQRLMAAGASPADVGQQDVPWVVLADPEGNELCVLDPRDDYAQAGPVAAVVVDAPEPARLAGFWAAASGWDVLATEERYATLVAPGGAGPRLGADPGRGAQGGQEPLAPGRGPGRRRRPGRRGRPAEGARVPPTPTSARARTTPGSCLADPAGNEFCVLSPPGLTTRGGE